MATNRVLQLLRSSILYESITAAKNAILTGNNGQPMIGADGEIRIARYNAGTAVKSLLCVYHTSSSLPDGTAAGWTFIEDAQSGTDGINALRTELNNLEAQVGQNGKSETFASGAASGSEAEQVLKGAQSEGTAPTNLTNAVTNVATYITTLDKTANAVDGKVVTTVSQANGQVSETQADLTDVKMGGYSKTSDAGPIAATDTLEVAVSKLENSIAKNEVASADASVTITQPSTGTSAGKTDLAVNVDGTTISKTNAGALQSVVKIVKQDANTSGVTLDSNVREQYVLADNTGAALTGDVIKIYKDSALTDVFLGHVDDTLNVQGSTYNKETDISNGTGSESLNFVYHLENGNYKMEKVDVETFLQESEFGNGLQIVDHMVSVKPYDGITVDANGVGVNVGNGLEIDSTSKAVNVKIDSTNDSNRYLSVSASGVALNGNTIDEKIANAKTTITEVAAQSSAETTADGNDFIKVVKTAGSGATPDNYAISTQGIRDAIAVETTRAKNAETAIDTAVGLTKAASGEGRTYTSQVTARSGETAPATVAGDIHLLDAHVEALDDAAVKSVTGSNAININTALPANAKNPVVELKLSTIANNATDAAYAGASENNGNILQIKSDGLYLDSTWDCGVY